MEDILNSIRRIMADDHKTAPAKEPEPVHRDIAAPEGGSVEEDIKALRNALNAIRGEMEDVKEELVAQDASLPAEHDATFADEELFADQPAQPGLVSPLAEQSIRRSFADLSQAATMNREIDVAAMAENMLRPMLQQWLDAHLPGLVEKLVREEIARLSGLQS